MAENPSPERSGPRGDEPDFDEGRYLYCVVRTDGAAGGEDDIDVAGVEDGDPRLVVADGIGAVVQSCESLYTSERAETVKGWLLQHQAVVDEAGERFGTPLPFRFDTVLKGDDDRVREWLAEEADALGDALDRLAGQWEYRIEVHWDRERLAEQLATEDDRLRELRERREAASEGTAFLLEKQYERRREQLLSARREDERAALMERLEGLATEVQTVEQSASLLGAGGDGDRESETLRIKLAVLAPEDAIEAIGDVLDDVAADPGVEVRFTGPWPPYSFAPTLEGEE